jgi:Tfp pilus assembly protein PilO
MRARLNALLRRLGAAGIVGLGVLFACAGFWFSALQPLEQELAAQRAALERLRARTPSQPAAGSGRAEELRRFYSLFPASTELASELERLHRLARGAGLELAQGEYRLERRPAGTWAYRVTLPVRGTYPQLRQFLGALLKDMPIASLDAMRFERKKAAETQLEAQLRVTLHARPPGGEP